MSQIYLLPGEFYFGDEYRVIKTLLGSCVAITMWSSCLKVGGMCHYKLPRRLIGSGSGLDGNFGEEAVLLFLRNMKIYNLRPEDMTVGVFGAANMFSSVVKSDERSIGVQNIKLAHQLMKKYGFNVSYESLGGNVSRKVLLDISNGAVKVQGIDSEQQKVI